MSRWIAHVDMDAFFVSVELLRRPELRGKPVVVATGTDPGARGVVMAASYEARRFGVQSALPLAIAHRRCPQAVLIPRDMALYRKVSGRVMSVVKRFSRQVEVAGLDEAYLDLSELLMPKSYCRRLKHQIRVETGLPCSVGLAPNKLLAKIASDLDKPDGFFILKQSRMLDAVGDRPATLIPGVGPRTAERLQALGVRTVEDLARTSPGLLERAFGPRLGMVLRDRANGIDDRGLEVERKPKSESCETTFSHDVEDRGVLLETLEKLVADVCKRLGASSYCGRTVAIKIRLRPFRTHTRSCTLGSPTRDPQVVRAVATELLGRVDIDAPVRLLGVGVTSLVADAAADAPETGLFAA